MPVTNNSGQGYNMIGNPYPSPINADLFLASNPGTLYFWTHVDQNAGSAANYATYTTVGTAAGSGGEIPNGTIQTGQGFMLRTTTGGTASFTNAMRIDNHANQFFRTATNDKSRIWLNLSSSTAFMNQMLVGYLEGATVGVDQSVDGKLIDDNSTTLSNLIDNNTYTIQGRPMPFENTDVVALNFKAVSADTYVIGIDHVDGLFADDQAIYIKDNITGIVHNIKESNYSFASEAGTFTNRFAIVFQNTNLGIENPTLNSDNVVAYVKNDILNINAGSTIIKDVKVFDLRGRMISEKSNINTTVTSIDNLKVAQQVLLIQITSKDNQTVTKKIVY
ncbi:T9SS sorting signal type C domain-containing protein [Flavobacterium sp. 3HN19-14]|uniref:T9SS sorting signal type C domain-containing protein n=1 Tax=Flavobacterium sp. 3HN19-14 TaxID=3448133 RepID=UPI003EDEEC71